MHNSIDALRALVEAELCFKDVFVNIENIIDRHAGHPEALSVSNDGYVRITKHAMSMIPMKHLDSGLFAPSILLNSEVDGTCEISGYTEWISETAPSISIGWNWTLNYLSYPHAYEITGLPYSNVLLLDEYSRELSEIASLKALARIVDKTPWATEIERHITQKYK